MEFFWTGCTEILKIILSWPPIALLMLIIIISIFKDQIASLLGRVTSGKILGNEFQTAPINQLNEAAHIAKDSLLAKAESVGIIKSKTDDLENKINSKLSDPANPAIDYIINNPYETLNEYQRVLRSLNFEIILNRIFGTQIKLLELLASQPTMSFTPIQLYHFYQEHQKLIGSNDYQVRDYFNFLIQFNVIRVSGTDNNHTFSITEHGLDFLSYIKSNYKGTSNLRSY